ncbi:MAG TPA: hypothetical protein PLL10_06765 [Elusimicrobiales bacterium]|nr:hypothetical protein [Elusimicrobiales bacterium]
MKQALLKTPGQATLYTAALLLSALLTVLLPAGAFALNNSAVETLATKLLGGYHMFAGEPKPPLMKTGLVCDAAQLPQTLAITLESHETNTTRALARLDKVKGAFLCIKHSSKVPHAFTVFVFDKGGLTAEDYPSGDALVVTLATLPPENGAPTIYWDFFAYRNYIMTALREGKDRIQFYRYKLPQKAAAMMLYNASVLARRKSSNPEIFGLLDNNCIMNTLEIPNSIRPDDKQLNAAALPTLAARQLQLKGMVGAPITVHGDALLNANFDEMLAGRKAFNTSQNEAGPGVANPQNQEIPE